MHCEINKAEFQNPLPIFLFKGQLFYFLFLIYKFRIWVFCWMYALQLFFSLWKVCSHLNCILLHQLYKIGNLKVLTRPFSVYSSKPLIKAKVREFLHGTYTQVTQDFYTWYIYLEPVSLHSWNFYLKHGKVNGLQFMK